jgi:hypothetical protein
VKEPSILMNINKAMISSSKFLISEVNAHTDLIYRSIDIFQLTNYLKKSTKYTPGKGEHPYMYTVDW